MSKDLIYSVGGKKVSRLEAIEYYTSQAKDYPEPEKSAFLAMIAKEFENDQKMENTKTKWQTIAVPIIGIVLLLFSVYMAFIIPNPSKYQSGVIWVLVCLSTAISSVLIAGSVEYTNKIGIKAVGGTAIFCIMYFFVPKIYDKTESEYAQKLSMFWVASDSSGLHKIDVDFDRNSSDKIVEAATEAIHSYTGFSKSVSAYTCYRKSDGKIYTTELCREIKEFEVLMICENVCNKFENKHMVYLHFKKQIDSLSSLNE